MKAVNKTNEKIAIGVTRNVLISNCILSAFKLFAGIFAGSMAMVSDAAHSLSDSLTSIGVIIGVKMGNRQADKGHPYGHERFESGMAVVMAFVLFVTGAAIGWAGVQKIISGTSGQLEMPGMLALVAAIVSIVSKEGMYWYTRIYAKRIDSSILMADAWHHRSDAISSVGSFIGIFGARMGLPLLDPLASVVISVFILKVAVDIFRDAMRRMTDTSCSETLESDIRAVVMEQEHVVDVDNFKTRLFGDKIYVDLEICVDGNIDLYMAHNISLQVHDAIETRFEKVKHCLVHVKPTESV